MLHRPAHRRRRKGKGGRRGQNAHFTPVDEPRQRCPHAEMHGIAAGKHHHLGAAQRRQGGIDIGKGRRPRDPLCAKCFRQEFEVPPAAENRGGMVQRGAGIGTQSAIAVFTNPDNRQPRRHVMSR